MYVPAGDTLRSTAPLLWPQVLAVTLVLSAGPGVSFVTVKLEFLRKLSELTPDERDLFHHCKLNIRIDNLARRFQLIMKVLGEFEEIQSMAR